MASSGEQRRVTKRSSNACSRCRRQKIKCSGLQPCSNCIKRSLNCIFDDRDNKVLVTQGYLADLQQKISRLEKAQTPGVANFEQPISRSLGIEVQRDSVHQEHSQDNISTREDSQSCPEDAREGSLRRNIEGPELTNPLLESPSKFMSSSSGRSFYLGTSSNWSFHGQILNLVHEHTRSTPLPGTELLFDGSAYSLPWDGSRSLPETSTPVIPSADYAIFLINAVKFHCSQLVHLFDEDIFMENLHTFYSHADSSRMKESLWYIQFLLIVAFGRTLVQRKHTDSRPPGVDFFVHVLQLLPDTSRLCQEPLIATEILCGIALYLQALDSRNAAHVTIGQAMRIALAEGMHTDMPIELGEPLVQRCRKIWWSIYILDRQMSSQMGLPLSIQDDDISCKLTYFAGSTQRTAALKMQIRLARIYSEISRTVYGSKGRLRRKFVLSIKAVLDNIASVAEELRKSFPLHLDERFGGISRMPAHLHLMYYQAIVVTTRPLLFCCLKKVFESPSEVGPLVSSHKIRPFLTMSLDSSRKILNILEDLQDQDLMETFLPWDLDALFVATMVLILIRFIDETLLDQNYDSLKKAFSFLDVMISSGNRIAEFRCAELRKLDEMLAEHSLDQTQTRNLSSQATHHRRQRTAALGFPPVDNSASNLGSSEEMIGLYTGFSDESSGFGDDLTADQILAVAESMDIGGADWLSSFTTMETYQMVDSNQI